MVTPVTIYRTSDGEEFSTLESAEKYDKLCSKVDIIMQGLRDRPENKAVRQVPKDVKHMFRKLMDLCAQEMPLSKWKFDTAALGENLESGETHISWVQREVSDHGIPCILRALYRFTCISDAGIEYEQPYYVRHEDEWKGEIV